MYVCDVWLSSNLQQSLHLFSLFQLQLGICSFFARFMKDCFLNLWKFPKRLTILSPWLMIMIQTLNSKKNSRLHLLKVILLVNVENLTSRTQWSIEFSECSFTYFYFGSFYRWSKFWEVLVVVSTFALTLY